MATASSSSSKYVSIKVQRKNGGVVVDWYAIDVGEGDVTFAQLYERLVAASEFRPDSFKDVHSRAATTRFYCNDERNGRGVEVYDGLKVGQATSQFGCFVRIEVDKTATTKAKGCQQKSAFEEHPLEHKLAVIKTLFHRADNIVTSDQAKTDEQKHLRGALAKCGYQNWTFNKALKPSDQSKKTQKCKPLTNKNKANITIPYVQGVSEKLRRIFQNFNIATNFKPHSTLRQRLVHPKDRPQKGTKANVIYRLKCEEPNCNNTYIGETSRPLKVRYKEHCRSSANGYSSAIFHHLQHNQGHSFKLESTDILDRETRWWERGVKEAIYERMYNPTLNREGGLRVMMMAPREKGQQQMMSPEYAGSGRGGPGVAGNNNVSGDTQLYNDIVDIMKRQNFSEHLSASNKKVQAQRKQLFPVRSVEDGVSTELRVVEAKVRSDTKLISRYGELESHLAKLADYELCVLGDFAPSDYRKRYIYITAEECTASTASTAVRQRLKILLDTQHPDLVVDMRSLRELERTINTSLERSYEDGGNAAGNCG
ncbi:hypothetical protein Bbelb_344360 [Branchiostoma belcheri]|nr:hypothetical protein Bbelb_344360 [Branchiostoma belcheri]